MWRPSTALHLPLSWQHWNDPAKNSSLYLPQHLPASGVLVLLYPSTTPVFTVSAIPVCVTIIFGGLACTTSPSLSTGCHWTLQQSKSIQPLFVLCGNDLSCLQICLELCFRHCNALFQKFSRGRSDISPSSLWERTARTR